MSRNQKYKGAGFDLDGVLHESAKFEKEVVPFCLQNMIAAGLNTTMEVGMDILNKLRKEDSNSPEHFDDLFKRLGLKPSPRIVTIGAHAYHQKKFELINQEKKIIRVLDYLRDNNFKLFIVTSGVEKKQWYKLIRGHIDHYFSGTYNNILPYMDNLYASDIPSSASLEDKIKIKKGLFERAIDEMELDLKRSFAVDDRPYGLIAAMSAERKRTVGREGVMGIKYTIRLKAGKYVNETFKDCNASTPSLLCHQVIYDIEEIPLILKQKFRLV